MSEERGLATVELLGALAYGQLRSFEVTTRAVRHAPDVRTADRLADFALAEHAAYRRLRDHLTARTDLAGAVMDRQRPRFDGYFDEVPVDDWLGACTFFAVGLPIAADFIREVAPALDDPTASVVLDTLAERSAFEAFAQAQLTALVGTDADAKERARTLSAEVLGRALTGFQEAVADTDALDVLLAGDEESGDSLVKRTAMTVLEGHRRRLHEMGLEELD